MRRLDVQIPAPDGHSNGTLHVPDGNGPWPGVLVFPTRAERGRRSGRWATGWHLLADRVTATVYVAGAKDDDSFTAEQAGLLQSALTDAGVDHTLEFYPAHHGFAVPDNPTYDTEADARHWEALHELYRAHLQRP